ncbi:MAG TPA: error-prone DNA polymerase [Burkholderiaceae bacterium]|nr:error-prone DNA polymerase [Burkholderiaceae bacterium]
MDLAYTELHCASNFSFLRGASHPHELVERAIALGYAGLALTDECSFAGSVRAHLALREAIAAYPAARDFRLIHGTEIRLADGPRLVLLATSRRAYGDLAQLVTLARRQAPKGEYRLSRAELEAHADWLAEALVLWLPPEPAPLAARPEPRRASDAPAADGAAARHEAALEQLRWIAALAPERCWIACTLTRGPDDAAELAALLALGRAAQLPLVAAGGVLMHLRARKRLADVLAAIRTRTPLAAAGRRLPVNAERSLRPLYRLARIYPPELLAQTALIAARCRFSLEELRYEYPEEIVPPGRTPAQWLRELTYTEAQSRYPEGMPAAVRATVEHELAVIGQLGYEPYFLTVHDIVRYARSRGILCQGRGSAANSAVCYCLGVTEVDPARMSVLFERFISPERNEPPDIDVDFEHERREEVMQYLYAKYGRHRAALTAALHTYRPKGAVRDVGKALGLSLDQVDRLARSVGWWDGRSIKPERLVEAGFDPANPRIALLVALTHELTGFPRHLSQHSGGFVLARDRLDRLVPIENAAMAERTVIQWDKDDLDALGLLKVDVLALGMLTCIRRAFRHLDAFYPDARRQVSSHGTTPAAAAPAHAGAPRAAQLGTAHAGRATPADGHRVRMQDIPDACDEVYAMLSRGDSLGVFQVESRAQMAMLPRLAPNCFYDLVIETAIVRPGPIQGGMVHPYLRRRQGLEPVSYPSEAVRGVLERTLGVSIFQEQVMQLAVVAAGFTPGEADQLRRAMAAWRRKGGLGPFRDKLLAGMLARGYSAHYAEQIYRQIQGFGEYGFPESHAASFALLVYVSAWLKCHEPAAFCAALLDAQPLGFYAPAQIVQDARRHGVQVLPIDVLASDWDCHLVPEPGTPARPAVRLGLKLVAGFNEAAAQRLVQARSAQPPADLEDLVRRACLDRAEVKALAAADALAALAGHRRQALWSTLGLDAGAPLEAPLAAHTAREAQLELLPPTEGQDIVADYRHTALTLRRHPLALLRPRLAALRLVDAEAITHGRHKQPVRTSGIVTCRQRPGTASGVTFVTLEDETGCINVVVWRATAERHRRALLGATLLTVYGHIERVDTGVHPVVHVIAQRLVDHSALLGQLTVRSHDFH